MMPKQTRFANSPSYDSTSASSASFLAFSRLRYRSSALRGAPAARVWRGTRRECAVHDRILEIHRASFAARVHEPRLAIVVGRETPTAAERVRINDDEAVALRGLVQPRVLRHRVLVVDQHAVKCDDQGRRAREVHARRHEQPIRAPAPSYAERLIGKIAMRGAGMLVRSSPDSSMPPVA